MKGFRFNKEAVMPTEMVICSDMASEKAHKALFSFPEGCYVSGAEQILDLVASTAQKELQRLHIAAGFEAILKLALWTEKPEENEVRSLLLRTGVDDAESAVAGAGIEEIFSRLYDGRRFDVLKRICRAARLTAQSRIGLEKTSVHCHLVSADVQKIVASSL